MIRAPKLLVSRPMYAFQPATWRPDPSGHWFRVDAVWFRRKAGRTLAAMGCYDPTVLRDDMEPTDGLYESWITAADDNRYGAHHVASWDGRALLCTDQGVTPAETNRRIEFLTAVLAGFPDVPAGWDGWWTFQKGNPR